MWKSLAKKSIWSLALLVLILPGAGCRRSRGGGTSYTNVNVGVGAFVPTFLSGGGFYDVAVDDGYYVEDSYETNYYESDSGYYDEYNYGDDWKAKNPGRTKR